MKYETFDQPAYGVGDLETFGITDNNGSLVMDFSSDSGMESWRADSLLSEDLQAYTQVTRAHEMGGDGGTIPPPPPPPGGSDDDDTSTDDSSSDTSGSGDAGSGDDEEDTVIIEQGYDPTAELMQELMNSDSPDFVYQTEFGKLMEDYSSKLDPSAIAANEGSYKSNHDALAAIEDWENAQEQKKQDYWDDYQSTMDDKTSTFEERVIESMNNHTKELYADGVNDCDIWLHDRYEEAGATENPIKNPGETDVPKHSQDMENGQDTPYEGTNAHIKDGHLSAVVKQGETYTVGHQGENSQVITTDSGGNTKRYSNTYTYNSKEDFENSWWGDGTYYSVSGPTNLIK